MRMIRLIATITIAGLSTCALADGSLAARELFSNLKLAKKSLRVDEQDALVSRTLVHGMYEIVDAQGNFVTFVNEYGTLYGDRHGLYVFPKHGAVPRRIAADELAAFRIEVANAIDRDSLISVVYGSGGKGDKTILFSAIDCPPCHRLEKKLEQPGQNVRLLVAPGSLTISKGEGATEWEKVAKIWCAKDSGRAWRNFMSHRTVPAARTCAFSDPGVAEKASVNLFSIVRNSGVPIVGVPSFVYEDGTAAMALKTVRATFQTSGAQAKWLPATYPPNPSTGLPNDAFRARPVQLARR